MRFDLHTHSCYSDDAIQSPEELARAAKRRGLDGVALTDHNTTKGWKRLAEAARREKLSFIRAEEIKVTHEGRDIGEVIALFINEAIEPGDFHIVKDRIKAQGGLLAVAHPFDSFRNSFQRIELLKNHFDAVEAFNARVVLNSFNDKAAEFARSNGLPVIGGSDGHSAYEVGNAYTSADIDDAKELIDAIRHGKTRAEGKRTIPLIHGISTIAKLGIMKSK